MLSSIQINGNSVNVTHVLSIRCVERKITLYAKHQITWPFIGTLTGIKHQCRKAKNNMKRNNVRPYIFRAFYS